MGLSVDDGILAAGVARVSRGGRRQRHKKQPVRAADSGVELSNLPAHATVDSGLLTAPHWQSSRCARQELLQYEPYEDRITNEVTTPKPSRLANQSIKPLQTNSLHPSWSALRKPAQVI